MHNNYFSNSSCNIWQRDYFLCYGKFILFAAKMLVIFIMDQLNYQKYFESKDGQIAT